MRVLVALTLICLMHFFCATNAQLAAGATGCPCACTDVRPRCPSTCRIEECEGSEFLSSSDDFGAGSPAGGANIADGTIITGFRCCPARTRPTVTPTGTPTPSPTPTRSPTPSPSASPSPSSIEIFDPKWSPEQKGDQVRFVCVGFFAKRGFGCAGAKVVVLPCGIVLIIETLGRCRVPISVFANAYSDLKTRPGFSTVFDPTSNVLDYNATSGVSSLKLLFKSN